MADSGAKKANLVVCRWCGADPAKDSRVALTRVNAKGIPGIWECVPYCKRPAADGGADMRQ